VDVSGAQVLRVNDVHLIYSERKLIFGHVEVGMLGILRRLRFDRFVVWLVRWLFDYTIKESFVTWRHIQVLSPGGVPGGLRVSTLPARLADVHPAELADIMEDLGTKDRQVLFNGLPVEAAAEALEEVTPEYQRTLVAQGEPDRVADILEEMPSQEAAEVLRDMGPDAQTIINRMDAESAQTMKTILAHEEKTAGGVMATLCVEAKPEEHAPAVLERMRSLAGDVEVFDYVYVLDGERHLLGVLSLRELIHADGQVALETIMTRHVITAGPDTPLRDVARSFVKYGVSAIPVVDAQNVFLGAVRVNSALEETASLAPE
jgi:magnesium transporter